MQSLQDTISQIPIRHDIYSLFMFTGVFLGVFLSLIILSKRKGASLALRIYAFLLLAICIPLSDTWLCYTGLMKYTIAINDSTETIVLCLGPLFFLFTRSVLVQTPIQWKKDGLHFLLPLLYLISQFGYLIQGDEVKMNAYLSAYHPSFPQLEVGEQSQIHWIANQIKNSLHELIIITSLIYLILSVRVFREHYAPEQEQSFVIDRYLFSRNVLIGVGLIFFLLALNFALTEDDTSEHYVMMIVCLAIVYSNYIFLTESRLFNRSWLKDKYDTSGLSQDHKNLFDRIDQYVQQEAYYINSDASLKDLAERIQAPANYVSQAINSIAKQNFNDYLNTYRIEIAKQRLKDPAFQHLNVEGIGQSVGFRSKSSFYTAFKKFTGKTPAAFIKAG